LRVDAVWVVVLGCGLSRSKAGEGSEAEGECGTHVEYVKGVLRVEKGSQEGTFFAWTPRRV